jgi:hypothetical protein
MLFIFSFVWCASPVGFWRGFPRFCYKHINSIDKLKIKMQITKIQCKYQKWIRSFGGNEVGIVLAPIGE